MPWTLQTLGPIRFLSQLQAWLMSQFIVHADAAHVLLEEDERGYTRISRALF